MLFAIICIDKPDGAPIRAENRPAHLDHLRRAADRIVLAGPFQSEDRTRPTGSLLVLDFADRAEAEAFAAADPYNRAGLFESVTIRPFKKIFPAEG